MNDFTILPLKPNEETIKFLKKLARKLQRVQPKESPSIVPVN